MSAVSDRQVRAGIGTLGVGAIGVGIAAAIGGFWLHHHYGPLNAACNSSFGQLGQAVNSDAHSMCNTAGTYIWVSYLLIAVGVLTFGWGLRHLTIAAVWNVEPNQSTTSGRPKASSTSFGASGLPAPDGRGIFITRVTTSSRAGRAGLKPGMRLLAIGHTTVQDPSRLEAQWQAARRQATPGEVITARVEHGGTEEELALGRKSAAQSSQEPVAGVSLPADDGPCLICGSRLLVPIPMQEHVLRAHPDARVESVTAN